jgi:hypothetical protein
LGVALLALALYLGASAWIVRSVAESYRRDLASPALTIAAKEPSQSIADTPAEVTKANPEPKAVLESAPPEPEKPAPSPTPSPDFASTPKVAEASPPKATADTAEVRTPAGTSVSPPQNQDPFWNSPAMKEVWNLDKLSTEDEVRLGRALHEMILRFHKPNTDGPWTQRAEEAAEPLLKTVTRKDIPYTFTVLDSDAVNAFSAPGGYVYVSRGLFDLIGEDEDYMLQFVVGHEIAHVDLKHAIACLQDPGVKQLDMGTLAKFYLIIIPFGYLDRQDLEADRWVFERMVKLDCTRLELFAFLRKFERYARAHGFENRRCQPEPGNVSPIDNHLRAHVIVRSRLKQLTSMAPATPKPTR